MRRLLRRGGRTPTPLAGREWIMGRLPRTLRDRRGSIMMLFGLGVMSLFVCIGLAVDATRLWLLRAKLQTSVDAAVLQAVAANENTGDQTKSTADASSLFWANYGRTSSRAGSNSAGCPSSTINAGYMGSTMCGTGLEVTYPDSSHARVQATASLPTTLMAVKYGPSVLASAFAVAQRAGGVEMALVLDISLSMQFQTSDGSYKIDSLRTAANNMLTALYGNATTLPNLWVSVVPFAGAVNVGNSHTAWLDSTFTSGTFGGLIESDDTGRGWRGCVEARQGVRDITEDGPGTASFAPFYWPTTYNQYAKQSGGYYLGDNDWYYPGKLTDTRSASQLGINGSILRGPNLGCPHLAVVPPTASKATVANAVNLLTLQNLTGPVGTVVVQGLQWGWFTLSPSWQGSSGWNLTTPAGAALPLSYAAPNNKKVIVLMTDGTTDVSGAQTWYGNANSGGTLSANCNGAQLAPSCIPRNSGGANAPKSSGWTGDADTWYSPYGRASAGRISTVQPTYTASSNTDSSAAAKDSEQAVRDLSAALDSKTAQLCTAIKAQGIIVYTIFFHGPTDDFYDSYLGSGKGSSAAKTILQNCATDTDHFYDANNAASVNGAFVSIAKQISALRLQQ